MITEGAITFICQRYRVLAGTFNLMVRGPSNPIQRKQGKRYLTWCAKNSIDPVLFMEDRAAHAKATKQPIPLLAKLCSTGALESHRTFGAAKTVTAMLDRTVVELDTRRKGKLKIHQEKFKSYYAHGKEELCARYQEHTGGFAKASYWCGRCSVTASCIDLGRR